MNFQRSGSRGYVATGGGTTIQDAATQTVSKAAGTPLNLTQKVN